MEAVARIVKEDHTWTRQEDKKQSQDQRDISWGGFIENIELKTVP